MSNDALPTPQHDGVGWATVMKDDTVYVGGRFTAARPDGAAAGQNTVARSNLLSFSVASGQLLPFNPSFNGQILAMTVSPDKTRLYVGGEFTTVNGQQRSRIAAFNTATGGLVGTFAPPVNARVRGLTATNSTVYAGGDFSAVGNVPRAFLASFSAANGALLDWAPQATGGGGVAALIVNPQGTKVAVGGSFTALNGSSNPGYGLGMVDSVTGVSLPMAINSIVRNGTTDGAIDAFTTDGTYVYGSGWTFGRSGGTMEGVFAASWDGGETRFINDCHGDTYGVHLIGKVIYTAGHTHYCENLDGVRQGPGGVGDYPYYRAIAMTNQPTRTLTWEPDQGRYVNFAGQPAPENLAWYPSLNAGTVTGQFQGPWSVTGNSDYVVLAGEFTRVNNRNQQGITRFAVKEKAPNLSGPKLSNTTYPLNVSSTATGSVRINWMANRDDDNENLTYRLYRDSQIAANLKQTITRPIKPWESVTMGFTDTGLAPGSTHQYRVVVTDPFGNAANSPWTSVTVASSGSDSNYVKAVYDSQPTNYWRLGDVAGTTVTPDRVGFMPSTALAGVTRGAPGAIKGDTDTASSFNGTNTSSSVSSPQHNPPDVFSVEAWFQTTSLTGGRIVGWSNRNTQSNSSKHDRHLYMDATGRLHFGARPTNQRLVVSSTDSYNNGQWHHAVGSMSSAGLKLFIDGVEVAARSDVTVGEHLSLGYWRIGSDTLNGWPSGWLTSTQNTFFNGNIDEVAVYKHVLAPGEVAAHYAAGTGGASPNLPPVAAFTAATDGLAVAVNGSSSTDADGTIQSYAWNFGDGGADTGATASHTYAREGTYTVTLSVTDDDGATQSATKDVTVTAAAAPFAVDDFNRTLTNGWGDADTGGAWVRAGTASNFAVASGRGTMRMGAAGGGPSTSLPIPTSSDTEMRSTIGLDKAATGGGTYITLKTRITPGGAYSAEVRYLSNGSVALSMVRTVGTTTTTLQTRTLTGLPVAPGDRLNVKAQAYGTSSTVLQAKVWAVGSAEPAAWTSSVTDSTSELQGAGSIGYSTYLSGSATNAPLTASFDDLWAGPRP